MTFTEEMPIWFSDFATAIQQDLLSLHTELGVTRTEMAAMRSEMTTMRSEMATKQDLADLREEIISRFVTRSELQSSIDMLRDEILEEIDKVRYAKEIDALRTRTTRIERKLGMGPDKCLS